jgi:hypothetical protein
MCFQAQRAEHRVRVVLVDLLALAHSFLVVVAHKVDRAEAVVGMVAEEITSIMVDLEQVVEEVDILGVSVRLVLQRRVQRQL